MTARILAAAAASALLAALACSGDAGPEAPVGVAAAPAAANAAPASADPVVAEIGGAPVLASELDAWIKDDWFDRETSGGEPAELYQLRSRQIKRMLDERVLSAEASRRGVDTEEVIAQELAGQDPVGDDAVTAFYEEHKGRLPPGSFEDLAPRIRSHLENERELQAIAALREKADVEIVLEPPRVSVAADGPAIGPDDARVTIVEFSDFQCPFCQRALPTIAALREKYPEDVRIVYRHLPLDRIHPRARAAAEASACADAQGRFWDYHDLLFENNKALEADDLQRYAAELELDADAFAACTSERRFQAKVDADLAAALAAGITSTPSFVVDGVVISGAQPVKAFAPLIEAALNR